MMMVQVPPLGKVETFPLTTDPETVAEQLVPAETAGEGRTEMPVKLLSSVSLKVAPLAPLGPRLLTTS